MAKIVSVLVKFGALLFVLRLPAPYAIEMQLLGGIWIGQIFPAVVIGAFTRWLHPWALFAGWAVGMSTGTAMALSLGLKSSVYPLHLAGGVYPMYAAVPALAANLITAALLTLLFRAMRLSSGADTTAADAYTG